MGGGKLLYPFITYSFLGYCVDCIRLWQEGATQIDQFIINPIFQLLKQGSIFGNLPLWFLLSLYMVRLIASWSCQKKKRSIIVALIAICLSFLLNQVGFIYPYYISNILSGTFFYTIGYLLANKQYSRILLMISAITYSIICVVLYTQVDMRTNEIYEGYYFLWPIFSLSGIIILNNLIRILDIKAIWLEYIGKYSMDYYVTHWLIISIIMIGFKWLGISCEGYSALLIIILIMVSYYIVQNLILAHERR